MNQPKQFDSRKPITFLQTLASLIGLVLSPNCRADNFAHKFPRHAFRVIKKCPVPDFLWFKQKNKKMISSEMRQIIAHNKQSHLNFPAFEIAQSQAGIDRCQLVAHWFGNNCRPAPILCQQTGDLLLKVSPFRGLPEHRVLIHRLPLAYTESALSKKLSQSIAF